MVIFSLTASTGGRSGVTHCSMTDETAAPHFHTTSGKDINASSKSIMGDGNIHVASSGTHSNEENIDPVLCLSELAGLDPSDAAYAIKEIRSQQNALLANCQTDVGDVYGDIKEDDSICSRQDESMQVFVRTPDGKTITLSVNQSTTVADLKRDISSKTYTPIDEMRVCYGGKLLIDGQTVFEYGITRDSTLDLHDAGLKGGSRGGDECPGTPGFDVALHDLENARQQVEDWSEHCSRQEKEINRLRQQADSARVALNESEEYRQQLEQRSSSVTRENATLRESNAAQEEQLVSTRYILSTLSGEFRDLRETNSRLTAELATQRQQVDSSTILQRQLDEIRSENDGLVSDVNTSRETIDRLRIEKTLQRETINRLRLSLDKMGTERDGLLAYLDTARGTIDGLRLEIEEMERAITASEETNSTLRATKDHLRLEVLEKDQVIAEFERRVARINEIDEQVEKLNRDNTYLCAESKRLRSDLKVMRQSNQRLEQENANLRERLNSSSAENTRQQTLLNDFANAATTHAEGLQAAVVQRDQTITERDQEIQRLNEQIQRLQSQQCETVEQPRDRFDSTSVTPAPSRRGDGGSSLAQSHPSATASASASDPSSPSASATASSSSIEGTSNETPRNPGDLGEEERAEFLEQMDRAGLLGDQSEAAATSTSEGPVVDDDSHGVASSNLDLALDRASRQRGDFSFANDTDSDPPSLPSSSSATATSSSSTTGSLLTKRASLKSDSDNSHSDSSEDGAIEPKAKKSKNSVEETSSESLSLHPVAGGVVVGGDCSRRSTKVVDYRKRGVLKDLGSHDAKVLAEREARDTSDDSSDDDNSNDDDSRFMTQDTTTSSASSAVATSSGDTAVDDSFSRMSSQSSIMTPTPSTSTSRADDSRDCTVAVDSADDGVVDTGIAADGVADGADGGSGHSVPIQRPLLNASMSAELAGSSSVSSLSAEVGEGSPSLLSSLSAEGTASASSVPTSLSAPSGAMVYNRSTKYKRKSPPVISEILEGMGLSSDDLSQFPLLSGVLTNFERKEILPSIAKTLGSAKDVSDYLRQFPLLSGVVTTSQIEEILLSSIASAGRAQADSDVAQAVSDVCASVDGENQYTVGSIIDVSNGFGNLPQHYGILGLKRHDSTAVANSPPTEAHALLLSLTSKYSSQFQQAKRPDVDDTTTSVVQRFFDEYSRYYSFLVVSKVDGPGQYKVKQPSFKINDCTISKDKGSIRYLLYKRLQSHHNSFSNNFLENKQKEKIDYFSGVLSKCQYKLGYDSAANFVPHSNLPDEDRKNSNYGIEKYDSTLNTLKQIYPRRTPTDPSAEEEIGRNDHLTTIEVAIIHRGLMELILSLHADYYNCGTWEKIAQLVAKEAIPSNLKELFEVPDWQDSRMSGAFIAKYLTNLIKVLSLQCWNSGYQISECGSRAELATSELDHILDYYIKSFDPSRSTNKDTTSHKNPYGCNDLFKRSLYEILKCRVTHFMWHPRGKHSSFVESQFQEGMCRELVLKYDSQVDKVLKLFGDGVNSVTFRQFFQIKEIALLILDWLSRGAFRQTKKPLVEWEALAIAPMELFHTALPDIMKYTKAEYNALIHQTRCVSIVSAINTLMARLSGGCSRHTGRGCNLVRTEMNSWKLQAAMDWNHRHPNAKIDAMSQIKHCPVHWHKEGTHGDCENECKCCHNKINEFQSGGPRPPGYTGN